MKKILIFIYLFTRLLSANSGSSITENLEYMKIDAVGDSWQSVSFINTYTDAIVVCTSILPSSTNHEVVVRITDVTPNSFRIMLQRPNDGSPNQEFSDNYSNAVNCVVSDEGGYSVPFDYEARKITSDATNENNNWSIVLTENISSIEGDYTKPVLLGQVMSYNDSNFSVFWSNDCDSRSNRPFQSGLGDGACVGKHVGEHDDATRADETLGYFVFEEGVYTHEKFKIKTAVGTKTIKGVDDTIRSYDLDSNYTDGIATQGGMRGTDGGFAVLYGDNPISTSINLAIDEDTTRDSERRHTDEVVNYIVFGKILELNVTQPECQEPVDELYINTYDTGSQGHPYNKEEYQTLIDTYAIETRRYGGGLIANINTTPSSNNNPYQPNPDDHYLTMIDGYIKFPETGIYSIALDGDDSVEVYIDGEIITGRYGGNGRSGSAQKATEVSVEEGWHTVEYHHHEYSGGDSYHLYWKIPGGSMVIVPTSALYHCALEVTLQKSSCVISDPVNGTTDPKRIPSATIRYALMINNSTEANITDANVTDTVNSTHFDISSIKNLQIRDGECACTEVASDSNNGSNGSTDGVNPVVLDFGSVNTNSIKCGYFEVDIK